MGEFSLGVMGNVLRAYAICRLLDFLYEPKEMKKWKKLLIFAGFVAVTSTAAFLFRNVLLNTCTNVIGLIFVVSCYKGSILKNIVIIASVFVVNGITEGAIVFSVFRNLNVSNINASLVICLVNMVFFLIVILLERTLPFQTKEGRLPTRIWVSLLTIPLISCFIMTERVNLRVDYGERSELAMAGLLLINIMVFYLYSALENYYKDKEEKNEFKKKVEMYSQQLDVVTQSYENIRSIRHDLKHHVTELTYLLGSEDTKGALDYVEEMREHLKNPSEFSLSGNKEIDCTLNWFLNAAKEAEIKIDTNILIPEDLKVHTYAINVILGNLLENAIEAARNSDERYLSIGLSAEKGIFHLKIVNSFSGEIRLEQHGIATNKKNREQHGIGLKSVRRIVEEAGGNMKLSWEGQRFMAEVILYGMKSDFEK